MKGKVLFILCSLLMLTACAFGFSACGESGNTTDGGNGNGSGNNGNTDPPPVIHIHEMEYSPAVDATCTEDGSIEFWYCSDCGKYYADEDGVKEIQEPSSIPATGHSWSEWSERKPATCTNEGEKFRKCENCGEEETELVQRIAHTMQFNVGKPSTCTETGLQDSYYCTLCKQYFHDELGEQPVTYEDLIIPTTNHSLNGYAELVPTCTISGHTAYFLCTDCGQYFYDYECTQPTTWEEIFRPAAGHTMTHYDAVLATCTENGNIEYWYCSSCDKRFADNEGITELSSITTLATGHLGITYFLPKEPTCTEDGYIEHYHCPTCNKNFADTHGDNDLLSITIEALHHNSKIYHPSSEATCIQYGNIEYWECWYCHKLFYDENATKEITDGSYLIAPKGHAFSDEWMSDETHHWRECVNCDEVTDQNEHTWDSGVVTIEPTCTETGIRTYTCTVCQATKTEEIAPKGHAFSDEWMSDETHHWHECVNCDEISDQSEHIWNSGIVTEEPTCTETGIKTYTCAVCQATKTEEIAPKGHAFSDEWMSDETHHWRECVNCDEVTDQNEHTWDSGVVTIEPTCTETGIRTYTCTVCQATKTEEIAPKGHVFSDEWMSDETHHWRECVNCDEVTDQNEHTWDSGVVTIEPTCTETGIRTYTCTVCQATKTEVIVATGHSFSEKWIFDGTYHWHAAICEHTDEISDKTQHNFVNGKCTVCGIAESGAKLEYKMSDGGYMVAGIGSCTDTDVEILSEYNGRPVTRIGMSAFNHCDFLTNIIIPDSITEILSGAFEYCDSLASVTIGNGLTRIMDYAFQKCSNLVSVYISNIVTWCNIDFEDANSNPLFYAKNLYLNSELVTKLSIPNGITSIKNYAFYNCVSLINIVLPETVTSIGQFSFTGCNALANINIPNSIKSIGESAFRYCSSLTDIEIPYGVTNIGDHAYADCTSLISVEISDSVKSISVALFGGCSALTNVTIGNGVMSIESNAFSGCSSLANIVIPISVTSIGAWAFEDCSSLMDIVIPSGVTKIERGVFDGCKLLTNISIPDGVVSIGEQAFWGCASLTSIEIPTSVTSLENYVFYGCKSLTYINIPKGVVNIGDHAFELCTSLTSIELPGGVTDIGSWVFWGCSSLTSISIPNSVTSIKDSAFSGCYALTTINYDGTVEQWNSILKDSNWDINTGDYTIYCLLDDTIIKS